MNWEDRHFKTHLEQRLRNNGAFLLALSVAPPPNHTLIHRSLHETPKPYQEEIEEILGVVAMGGLQAVVATMDTRTTQHYRQQLYIATIDRDEATNRLFRRNYITAQELRGA